MGGLLSKFLTDKQAENQGVWVAYEDAVNDDGTYNQNKVNINKSNTLISNSVSLTTTNTRKSMKNLLTCILTKFLLIGVM